LAEIRALASIGTVGSRYHNALAETVNGYNRAELIRGVGGHEKLPIGGHGIAR